MRVDAAEFVKNFDRYGKSPKVLTTSATGDTPTPNLDEALAESGAPMTEALFDHDRLDAASAACEIGCCVRIASEYSSGIEYEYRDAEYECDENWKPEPKIAPADAAPVFVRSTSPARPR